MTESNCPICSKPAAGTRFCSHHMLAEKNLSEKFEKWKHAYGKLGWEDYLKRVQGLETTGEWAKEVAKYLLERP